MTHALTPIDGRSPVPARTAQASDGARQATGIGFRIEPALAEQIAWRALVAAETRGETGAIERHHALAAAGYLLPDGRVRDALFRELAVREVVELGLLTPIEVALRERPALLAAVDLVVIGEARGRGADAVTCDPVRRLIGLQVPAELFDLPDRLTSWCRHGLGHAEDTLDPAFGFEPGIESILDAASLERMHTLWDISVDGRAAATGLVTRRVNPASYQEQLRRLLGPDLEGWAPSIVAALWAGPRPTFADLRRWAVEVQVLLVELTGPDGLALQPPAPVAGTPSAAGGPLPGGRCPLCRFPAARLLRPDTATAAAIRREYPAWHEDHGLCERCLDRALLAGNLRGVS